MPADRVPYHVYVAERRREEIAARKAAEQQKRDPELEAAFCAWAAYRVNGGDMTFEAWRREALKQGGQDGR